MMNWCIDILLTTPRNYFYEPFHHYPCRPRSTLEWTWVMSLWTRYTIICSNNTVQLTLEHWIMNELEVRNGIAWNNGRTFNFPFSTTRKIVSFFLHVNVQFSEKRKASIKQINYITTRDTNAYVCSLLAPPFCRQEFSLRLCCLCLALLLFESAVYGNSAVDHTVTEPIPPAAKQKK